MIETADEHPPDSGGFLVRVFDVGQRPGLAALLYRQQIWLEITAAGAIAIALAK